MRHQIVAGIAFGDKRAQLDILPCHLLRSHIIIQDALQFLVGGDMSERLYLLDFLLIHISLESVEQSIVGHFCRVGDVRKHRMADIIVDGFQYLRRELLAELLAFLIDALVRAA